MDHHEKAKDSLVDSELVLGAYGIEYRWKKSEARSALNGISFELYKGDFVALIGPNGSGKSTLLKVTSGILPRTSSLFSGVVKFRGSDLFDLPSYERAQKVVYVAPELRVEFPMTALELVSLGRLCQNYGVRMSSKASVRDSETIQWAMESCCCWDLRNRFLDSLSDGQKQLVALSRALAQGAKVLFLDEALSRMDLNHQIQVGKLLKNLTRQGWVVLIVAHDLNLISEWSDRALVLKEGSLLDQGPIGDVFTQEKLNKIYPDSNLWIGSNPSTGAPKVYFNRL